jgi:hypothetical protein
MKQIADNLAKSKYHQNFYDQSLGPSVAASSMTSPRKSPAAA